MLKRSLDIKCYSENIVEATSCGLNVSSRMSPSCIIYILEGLNADGSLINMEDITIE